MSQISFPKHLWQEFLKFLSELSLKAKVIFVSGIIVLLLIVFSNMTPNQVNDKALSNQTNKKVESKTKATTKKNPNEVVAQRAQDDYTCLLITDEGNIYCDSEIPKEECKFKKNRTLMLGKEKVTAFSISTKAECAKSNKRVSSYLKLWSEFESIQSTKTNEKDYTCLLMTEDGNILCDNNISKEKCKAEQNNALRVGGSLSPRFFVSTKAKCSKIQKKWKEWHNYIESL